MMYSVERNTSVASRFATSLPQIEQFHRGLCISVSTALLHPFDLTRERERKSRDAKRSEIICLLSFARQELHFQGDCNSFIVTTESETLMSKGFYYLVLSLQQTCTQLYLSEKCSPDESQQCEGFFGECIKVPRVYRREDSRNILLRYGIYIMHKERNAITKW